MKSNPSKKAVIFCLILTITASVILFLAGFGQRLIYKDLKNNCTAEVTGKVVNESRGYLRDLDDAESKYLTGKHWRHIEVEPDGRFRLRHLYCNAGPEHKGDKIIIHYDPNDPNNYYISDHVDTYKAASIFSFAASGLMLALSIFIITVSYKRSKAAKDKDRNRIYFDTGYGRFLFDHTGTVGYECDIKWEWNLIDDSIVTAFFDTDRHPTVPQEGYNGMIEKALIDKGPIDLDINKLITEIPSLKEIQPGKCYRKLEKLLLYGERTDRDVKKAVANCLLSEPGFIEEGASEQDIIDRIELLSISVYRNGSEEYGLFYDTDTEFIDLRLVITAGGKKELHYKMEGQSAADDKDNCIKL